MHEQVRRLIESLELQSHPEGGHFREIFRSQHTVTRGDDGTVRQALTSIYFLLARSDHSSWHVVRSDEVWHHYEGDPLELLVVEPVSLKLRTLTLGSLQDDGNPVQVVPAGHWQAARSLGDYTLAGCTVGPGFIFEDFALLRDDEDAVSKLRNAHPQLAELL